MGTVIRLLEQGARGRHADGGVPAGPGVSLPWMVALTPWWPAVLAFEFWSQALAAHAAALHRPPAGDGSRANVVPMAEFRARRVS